jgi:long-chain fatty acid transport protein
MKLKKIAALIAVAGFAAPVFATNGMNMEGYGPVATGMGGASIAYDNGTAGIINNPATLGLMQSGTSRLDVAIGGLHPDVTTKMAGMADVHSGGDAYYMPAIGYIRKDGKLAYGVGMMAQGGMGTEYGNNSFLSGNPAIPTMMGNFAGPTGQGNRSELGIGRLIFPVSYDVSDSFKLGGSIDYLWGGLDIQMVMSGQMFSQFAAPGGSVLGSATGAMVNNLPAVMGAFGLTDVNWAQFDFSEGTNGMKQKLKTDGWAGNIGFTWKASPALTIGAVYHAKTSLGDMEGNGTLRMNAQTAGGPLTVPITGKLKVVDFQWPETYGFGLAYQVNDQLMIAADYKRIGWENVMKNFNMSFSADATQADPAAAGMVAMGANALNATLVQNWKNQNVFMIGGAYKYSPALTLRAGLNIADDPIPDAYMNPLFPATIKDSISFGFGYAFSSASSIDFSLTHSPKTSVSNPNMGVTTTHSQPNNWQFMYSHRF